MKQDQLNSELQYIMNSIQIVIKTLKKAQLYNESKPVWSIEKQGFERMSCYLKSLIKLRDQKLRELVDSIKSEVA